jgi:hypothetical protein
MSTPKSLKAIALVSDDFVLGGPAQALLDRFLIGYPRDGVFHRVEGCEVRVWTPPGQAEADLDRRRADHGLVRARSLEAAVSGADGLIVMAHPSGDRREPRWVKPALEAASGGAACFVYGILGSTLSQARDTQMLGILRQVSVLAGTELSVTWRLPEVDVPEEARLTEALIVVQGGFPRAELDGLAGLLPVVERRRHGELGVHRVRRIAGDRVWQAGDQGLWSWPLLAAALSRSDSPQGDSVKDGRTQYLVGLGLVPKLAREPRGWLIDHAGGLRSAILVLEGVVGDIDFAVRMVSGEIISAQLYRPPTPDHHEFSRLAAVVEEFFRTGHAPWPNRRALLTAGLLETFATMQTGTDELATPSLAFTPRIEGPK